MCSHSQGSSKPRPGWGPRRRRPPGSRAAASMRSATGFGASPECSGARSRRRGRRQGSISGSSSPIPIRSPLPSVSCGTPTGASPSAFRAARDREKRVRALPRRAPGTQGPAEARIRSALALGRRDRAADRGRVRRGARRASLSHLRRSGLAARRPTVRAPELRGEPGERDADLDGEPSAPPSPAPRTSASTSTLYMPPILAPRSGLPRTCRPTSAVGAPSL